MTPTRDEYGSRPSTDGLRDNAVTRLERCAQSDERFATLSRDEAVALLNERTSLLVRLREREGERHGKV